MATTLERFLAKIEVLDNGCWRWTAGLFPAGYGQFRWTPQKNGYAHIWAYEHYIGPAPEGLHLDHKCRNRWCANPWHLEPVTPAENILRGVGAAAANARKTHCKNGHPLSGANISFIKGRRRCLICAREEAQTRREADRARARIIDRRHYARKVGRVPPDLPPIVR